MQIRPFAIAMIAAAVLTQQTAAAQSLKVKKAQQEVNQALQEDVKSTVESCGGAALTAEYDYSSVKDEDYEKYSLAGFCGDVLSSLRQVCSDDMGKDAVKQKVKKVVCKVGPKRAIELKDGVLSYTIEWEAGNNGDYITDFLMNHL